MGINRLHPYRTIRALSRDVRYFKNDAETKGELLRAEQLAHLEMQRRLDQTTARSDYWLNKASDYEITIADLRAEVAGTKMIKNETINEMSQDVLMLHDILASIALHGSWHWLTVKLTTPQKERMADVVDESRTRLWATDEDYAPSAADRWWRAPVLPEPEIVRDNEEGSA